LQCPNCSGKRVSDARRRLNPKTRQISIPSEVVLLGSIVLLVMLGFWMVWSRQTFPYSGQHSVFIWVGYGVMLGLLAGGVGYWYHHARAHTLYIHRCGCLRCGYRWQWRSDQPYQAPFIPEPPTQEQTHPFGEQLAWEERKERQEGYRLVSRRIDI
jgi:hypothetical protein